MSLVNYDLVQWTKDYLQGKVNYICSQEWIKQFTEEDSNEPKKRKTKRSKSMQNM